LPEHIICWGVIDDTVEGRGKYSIHYVVKSSRNKLGVFNSNMDKNEKKESLDLKIR